MTVALGMDGTALDDDDDAFREMRLALRLHRTPKLRSPAPSPGQIFWMATSGGAKLLGKETRLGRLAPGYDADLVLVDLSRVTWPWTAPEVAPRDLLVQRARADDVRTVIVGGEVVLRDGRPTGFDLEAVGREMADRLASTPFPDDAVGRVGLLREYLERFYAEWEVPELESYIEYNSRR